MQAQKIYPMIALAALAASTASAALFTDTFDGGSSNAGWTGGYRHSFIDEGREHGEFLRTVHFTDAPTIYSNAESSYFLGDYRIMGMERLGIELRTASAPVATGSIPLTLILVTDNDTPTDVSDDTMVYFVGPPIPAVGEGFVWYQFDVSAEETTLPAGWAIASAAGGTGPLLHNWNTVIQNVSRVEFRYGNPLAYGTAGQWIVDADNMEVNFMPTRVGDANGDGTVNQLDIDVVHAEWGPCEDCVGDVDGDGNVGVTDLSLVIQNWD